MPCKTFTNSSCALSGKLLHKSVVLAGSTVRCVVEVQGERMKLNSSNWFITGIMGWVVGQFKVDQTTLLKQNHTPPSGLTFEQIETRELNNLWFDCGSLFTKTLGNDALLFYCGPMEVQQNIEENVDGITVVHLSTEIPTQLPPSVRGRLFKAAYKILACVQLTSTERGMDVRTEALQFPLRILPSPILYHSLRAPDGSSPSASVCTHSDVRDKRNLSNLETNPFWCDDRTVTESGIENLLDRTGNMMDQLILQCGNIPTPEGSVPVPVMRSRYSSEPIVNVGQLRSALSRATQNQMCGVRASLRSQPFDPFGVSDKSDLASEQSSSLGFIRPSSATQPATFIISCAHGTVGRLCLVRTLFRMEDVLRGYFDFSEAQVPCLGCHLSLQCEERCMNTHMQPNGSVTCSNSSANMLFTVIPLDEKGEPQTPAFSHSTDNMRVTTWADIHLSCLSKQLLPFTLPIPINATPQFCVQYASLLIDSRWRLRLEFVVSPTAIWSSLGSYCSGSLSSKPEELCDPGKWQLPNYLPTEKLAWHFPIQLVSSDPSVVYMPQSGSAPILPLTSS